MKKIKNVPVVFSSTFYISWTPRTLITYYSELENKRTQYQVGVLLLAFHWRVGKWKSNNSIRNKDVVSSENTRQFLMGDKIAIFFVLKGRTVKFKVKKRFNDLYLYLYLINILKIFILKSLVLICNAQE